MNRRLQEAAAPARLRAWGAAVQPEGRVAFRLWAPMHDEVWLRLEGGPDIPMVAAGAGWFELVTGAATHGSRYRYLLPDGQCVPDPASGYQPDDVHGPSEVVDHARFQWSDAAWTGHPWTAAIVYELHVGTFTAEGTFQAATGKLHHLVDLGITAIELMPVADFPGARNWGYDGVYPYAPDSVYGRPEDLKAFIDAAHARGLMVIIDVVYNHFGPEGNYLSRYAPGFFTDRHETPWGAGINFDGPDSAPIRQFFIDNALHWIEDYHADGLRLDAIHAIRDDSPRHVVAEIADVIRARCVARSIHLLVENEENAAHLVVRRDGRAVRVTAQWNDDLHHALHAAATSERTGYYADYQGSTERLGRALAEGFAFQGELMPYRGTPRGEPSAGLPPAAFVGFIQNHDQVGNRAFGERLGHLAEMQVVRAVAAIYLLLPQIPLLFMGEEWNARSPFLFFCDYRGELAAAVRQGRREEFASYPGFRDPASRSELPDPLDERTFQRSKLAWADLAERPHQTVLGWYRSILGVRRQEIVPRLPLLIAGGARYRLLGLGAVRVDWPASNGEVLTLHANLAPAPSTVQLALPGRTLWREGQWPASEGGMPAWGVCWSVAGQSP